MVTPAEPVVESAIPLRHSRWAALRRAVGAVPMRLLPYAPRSLRTREVRRRQTMAPPVQSATPGSQIEVADLDGVRVVWLDRPRAADGVVVYLHGGAYIGGPDEAQWGWLSALQQATGTAACAVLYGMPPDHPHPGAIDDARTALVHLQQQGQLAERRWILAGDSAGGGLAVAVAVGLRDAGVALPAGLLLTAPWADLTLADPALRRQEGRDPVLKRRWLGVAADLYAGGTPRSDPALSPVYADLTGLPPVHLHVGTRDLLLPDARRLRDALLGAGVATTYLEQENGFHNYVMDVTPPAARHALAAQVRWVAGLLH